MTDNVTEFPPLKLIGAPPERPERPKVGGRKRPGKGDPRAKGTGGMGPGWGGPAKGPGRDLSDPTVYMAPGRERAERIADKAAAAERMLAIMVEVAEYSEIDMARISAADKVLDRIEGKAIQRQLNANMDVGLHNWLLGVTRAERDGEEA